MVLWDVLLQSQVLPVDVWRQGENVEVMWCKSAISFSPLSSERWLQSQREGGGLVYGLWNQMCSLPCYYPSVRGQMLGLGRFGARGLLSWAIRNKWFRLKCSDFVPGFFVVVVILTLVTLDCSLFAGGKSQICACDDWNVWSRGVVMLPGSSEGQVVGLALIFVRILCSESHPSALASLLNCEIISALILFLRSVLPTSPLTSLFPPSFIVGSFCFWSIISRFYDTDYIL